MAITKLKISQKNSAKKILSVSTGKCKRCGKGSPITDIETGELVCGTCGLVLKERIEDISHDTRSFMDGGDNRRTGVGTSLSRHDMGLATIINPSNKDATGKSLSPAMRSTVNRLRLWDSRSQAQKSSERNFRIAFNELGKLKDKLGLTDALIEKTAYIYRKAIDKDLVRGRSIHALLGASLYAACRDAETPRTLRDIEKESNVKRKELAKCYRMLVEKLNLKMPVVNAVQSVARISNKLNLSEKTKRLAIKILNEYQQTGQAAGKSPTGLAATVLYLACVKMGEKFTQREVASAANVTEVTIRNRAAAIRSTLKLNDDFTLFNPSQKVALS